MLSPNLILIIDQILSNQEICKYLNYNKDNPLTQPDLILPAKNLFLKKIFPYEYNPNITMEDCTQLRIYYPSGRIINKAIEDVVVVFDIIVAKTLWLVNDGKPLLRPYELLKLIYNEYQNKSISTVGVLSFRGWNYINYNDKFNGIRFFSSMWTL